MPQIRVSPDENSAYTAPRSRPPITTCTRVIDIRRSLSPETPSLPALPALVGQDERIGGAGLRPDGDVVAALELRHQGRGKDVLALVVELHAVIARDELVRLEVGGLECRLDLGGLGRTGA